MALSLQKRLSATLCLVLAISGLASFLILRIAIAPAFGTLESGAAKTDLRRAALAIEGQLQQVRSIAGDWAPWDETYDFALGTNADFVTRNLQHDTLLNLDIDTIRIYGPDGRLAWSVVLDHGGYSDPESLQRFDDEDVRATLTRHRRLDSVLTGMLMAAQGPMLVASMPVLHTNGDGPIGGTIVMGRTLTPERLKELREHIQVDFDIVPMGEARAGLPGVMQAFAKEAPDANVQATDDNGIWTFRTLTDIEGRPLGLLRTVTPREVTALGHDAADLALLLFTMTSLLTVGYIWYLLRSHIMGPIERLATHMTDIRRSGDLSKSLAPARDDEIGRLSREFNNLTEELQQARRQLVEHSFRAGRADTAADVLHNVRNAMTPVVDVAENLSEALQEMTGLHFRQAAAQLADPDCSEERRCDLLQYLGAAADRMGATGTTAIADVDLLCKQAKFVEEILSDQERAAREPPLRQCLDLADVVSEALNVLPRQSECAVEARIAPELASHFVRANRVQLLQVVGNVLLNACEAIERTARRSGRIDIGAAAVDADEGAFVELTIRDTGTGLAEGTSTRIFQRGYTSKQSAGNGLGLHWCANAVASMGGSIRAESAGPDRGTTVHIALPTAESQDMNECERATPRGVATVA